MTDTPLPQNGFLAEASDALRQMLEKVANDVHLDSGDVLFEQGDEAEALYAVLDGSLEVSVLSQDGRKLALNVMRAGSVFGEIALFDPGQRTATVTAQEASHIRRVRYTDMVDEVRREPDLAIDLIRLAGQRMRWMDQQLNEQVFLPMPTRLARKILYLTASQTVSPAKLSLSQSELAEFVGATREAVSKTLSGWKKQGVVEAARGGLTVRDRPALQVLADPELI